MKQYPRILSREIVYQSPWVRLVRKNVQFGQLESAQDYYFLDLSDYVTMFVQVPDGRIALIRQYRPAVEDYTLELPAGLIDPGETPEECCRRELKEETGLEAKEIRPLGSYFPDTGRLLNFQHAFYVRASEPKANQKLEEGLTVEYATYDVLKNYIKDGTFRHQLHIGVVALFEFLIHA